MSVAADPAVVSPDLPVAGSTDFERFDWSGFHVGINAGYLDSDASSELDSVDGPLLLEADVINGALPGSFSSRTSGALLGVQAGYDQQFGRFVLGLEGHCLGRHQWIVRVSRY